MTPFDDAKPKPSDPGDELKPLTPELPDDQLPLSLRYRDQIIERQQNQIRELEDELRRYESREREIIALVARQQREEAYRRLHQPYAEGLGGAGQCDCTMGRGSLIARAGEPPGLRARIERAILSMAKG